MPRRDGEMGLAGAGRPEEHDVVLGFDEVERAEMGDHVALEGALVIEVEVLEGLAGREAGGADAGLAAVGLAGRDLAFQAGGQELLVAPGLGPGPLGETPDRGAQRRRLERPTEIGDVGRRLEATPSRHPGGAVIGRQVAHLDVGLDVGTPASRIRLADRAHGRDR